MSRRAPDRASLAAERERLIATVKKRRRAHAASDRVARDLVAVTNALLRAELAAAKPPRRRKAAAEAPETLDLFRAA
jgi:hypothetical protein